MQVDRTTLAQLATTITGRSLEQSLLEPLANILQMLDDGLAALGRVELIRVEPATPFRADASGPATRGDSR